jgi:hypothetical protein
MGAFKKIVIAVADDYNITFNEAENKLKEDHNLIEYYSLINKTGITNEKSNIPRRNAKTSILNRTDNTGSKGSS